VVQLPTFSPSLRHRLVVEVIRRTRRSGDPGDPATYRERFLARAARVPRSVPEDYRESSLGGAGLRVLEHVPEGTRPTRTLMHLHGGGYTQPVDGRHFVFLRRLARELGTRVLLPLYPLAPEHTWRDSREALVELVGAVSAESPDGVVLSGDSAGGGYAMSVAQGVRDGGGVPPTELVLISPWVDLSASAPDQPAVALTDPWLTLPTLHVYAAWWAGSEEDRTLPEASPGLGDLRDLPRTLTLCGTRDLLHPENVLLAARAHEAAWDLTFIEGHGLIHVYPLLPIPEARVALRQIVDFLS
jgi:monoterpene epsilon-lactone hydrolase